MAMDYMKNKAKMDEVCNNQFSELNISLIPPSLLKVQAVHSFLKRPWFGRVWVLKEAASSSSAIHKLGSFSKVIRSESVQEPVEIIHSFFA